jgi:hypothetical protein
VAQVSFLGHATVADLGVLAGLVECGVADEHAEAWLEGSNAGVSIVWCYIVHWSKISIMHEREVGRPD